MSSDPTTSVVTADEHEEQRPDAAARVLGWRLEQLCAAGYDGEAALALALDKQVDLHFAISLVRRGCPVETAWRILT
jgi:hypothetical protein